jgi:hypothetical protein
MLYVLFCGANNVGSKGSRSVATDHAMAPCEEPNRAARVSRLSILPSGFLRFGEPSMTNRERRVIKLSLRVRVPKA